MGWNSVHVLRMVDDDDLVRFYVKGHNGGTRRWQAVVDTLVGRIDEICTRKRLEFLPEDPHLSAGRGARYRAPKNVVVLVLAELERSFASELQRDELIIHLGPIPRTWLETARVVVGRRMRRDAARALPEL